jgi:hypothetical protein
MAPTSISGAGRTISRLSDDNICIMQLEKPRFNHLINQTLCHSLVGAKLLEDACKNWVYAVFLDKSQSHSPGCYARFWDFNAPLSKSQWNRRGATVTEPI